MHAAIAAELDQPGFRSAPSATKLCDNAQFHDRPGACKLIETAAGRGDPAMTPCLAECRANRSVASPSWLNRFPCAKPYPFA